MGFRAMAVIRYLEISVMGKECTHFLCVGGQSFVIGNLWGSQEKINEVDILLAIEELLLKNCLFVDQVIPCVQI